MASWIDEYFYNGQRTCTNFLVVQFGIPGWQNILFQCDNLSIDQKGQPGTQMWYTYWDVWGFCGLFDIEIRPQVLLIVQLTTCLEIPCILLTKFTGFLASCAPSTTTHTDGNISRPRLDIRTPWFVHQSPQSSPIPCSERDSQGKISHNTTQICRPITIQIMREIKKILLQRPHDYNNIMMWVVCCLAFFSVAVKLQPPHRKNMIQQYI